MAQRQTTAPSARGRGIGRNLIEAVYAAAEAAGSSRVYWLTHETNAGAMGSTTTSPTGLGSLSIASSSDDPCFRAARRS